MSLLTPLLWIAIMLPFIITAIVKTEKPNLKYLFYFILYFLLDCLTQALAKDFISLDAIGLHFAWAGKILSLLLSLAIILSVSKQEQQAIGFTLKTNSNTQVKFGVLIVTVLFC